MATCAVDPPTLWPLCALQLWSQRELEFWNSRPLRELSCSFTSDTNFVFTFNLIQPPNGFEGGLAMESFTRYDSLPVHERC